LGEQRIRLSAVIGARGLQERDGFGNSAALQAFCSLAWGEVENQI
jgi:hypothetical protein